MRQVLVFFATMIASLVHAENMEKLALMSLIGDTLSVVVYQPSVGSHIDRNLHQVLDLPDNVFDETATKAAMESMARKPGAATIPVVLLALRAAAGSATISSGKLVPSVELQAALQNSGATHLLLFTKYRSESLLKTANGATGTGYLEGLGFYIDRSMRMRRSDTGELGTGFLAPFAYFRVSLVELSSFNVVKEEAVRASTTLSSARLKDGFDPWEVLTAEQKIKILQKLIRTETARAVPLLLITK